MKTYTPKPTEVERRWWVVDAEGEVLGRLSSRVAAVLRGKHKPTFSPHLDVGDHVVMRAASYRDALDLPERAVFLAETDTQDRGSRRKAWGASVAGACP